MITYNYKVNMTPGGIAPRCKLNQYDDDWTIIFSLYTDSGNFTLESGTTAKIRGTKRDGLGYSANATVDIANKTVTVAGDKQITAVSGENTFEIVLYKGQKELSTANVIFFVEQAAMDSETLISDSQVQEILDMSADVIAASENLNSLRVDISDLKSDVDTLNDGGLVLKDDVIAEDVQNWLDEHPEATTTVQDGAIGEEKLRNGSVSEEKLKDGSVSEEKLSSSLRFVDSLDISQYMVLFNDGYTSTQGICVIDNTYLCITRYVGNNRSFGIYNISTKELIAESLFTSTQVDHCNSICYSDGYIYVATLNSNRDIVRLRFDSSSKNLTYVDVVYNKNSGDNINASNVTSYNGTFFMSTLVNNILYIYKTTDFVNVDLAFSTDLNGATPYIVTQALACDDKYIYIPLDYVRFGRNQATSAAINWCIEQIYIYKYDGEFCKMFEFPRIKFGELESVDVVTIDDNKYIIAASNCDNEYVSSVYFAPLFKDTKSVPIFNITSFSDSFYDSGLLTFYVNSQSTGIGDGTSTNPFKSVYQALHIARKYNIPCEIFISGTFDNIIIRNMYPKLNLYFDNNTIVNDLSILNCTNVYVNGASTNAVTVQNQLKVEASTVFARQGINVVCTNSSVNATEFLRAVFSGYIKGISGGVNQMRNVNSIVNVSLDSVPAGFKINIIGGLAVVGGNVYTTTTTIT